MVPQKVLWRPLRLLRHHKEVWKAFTLSRIGSLRVKKLYGLFLSLGLNCHKATEPLRGDNYLINSINELWITPLTLLELGVLWKFENLNIFKIADFFLKTWTLKNLDPEKQGITVALKNMSDLESIIFCKDHVAIMRKFKTKT